MSYKIGDKVRVKNHIKIDKARHTDLGLYVNMEMEKCFGKSYIIRKVDNCGRYYLSNMCWLWDDCCLTRCITFK